MQYAGLRMQAAPNLQFLCLREPGPFSQPEECSCGSVDFSQLQQLQYLEFGYTGVGTTGLDQLHKLEGILLHG